MFYRWSSLKKANGKVGRSKKGALDFGEAQEKSEAPGVTAELFWASLSELKNGWFSRFVETCSFRHFQGLVVLPSYFQKHSPHGA